jgi:protein tyrosine phosphatase
MFRRKLKPKGRGDDHTFDYSKIIDKLYIGSDLCKGSDCPVHHEEFGTLGINVEINLSKERRETPPRHIDSYSWIPVVDGHAPNQVQLNIGTSIINEAVSKNKKIYVHCKNGHGRSPTMVAAYLIRFKNYDVDQAVNFISKKRSEVHIEDTQRKALRKYKSRWSK